MHFFTDRRATTALVYLLALAFASSSCSSTSANADDGASSGDAAPPVDAGTPDDTDRDSSSSSSDGAPDSTIDGLRVRIVAANTSSGASTSYDPPESIRLFQGLKPDVVLLQEFKYGNGTAPEIKSFVTTAFGATYDYYREPALTNNDIPNGIISRYPIAESGSWDDPNVDNRGFAWAKITIPNAPHPLWAISLHLLTSSASNRDTEAKALVAKIKEVVPPSDYLVVGGDFNTSVRTEPCITALSEVLVATSPYPDDGAGNENTNAPRTKAFDWLLADSDLAALSTPVAIGSRAFPAGLVFDSRVYQPLADVAPIAKTDSDALNMQHMPVVRDFAFPK